jgi:hypothetical protein
MSFEELMDMPLRDARALDEQLAAPQWLAEQEDLDIPLWARPQEAGAAKLPGDPGAKLKPKGGGHRVKLEDHTPAIKKMLAKNRNRSQYGPNFRNQDQEEAVRYFYADHSDIS